MTVFLLARRDDLHHVVGKWPLENGGLRPGRLQPDDYAAGLTLHQHNVHIANISADLKKMTEPEVALIEARLRLTEALVDLLDLRKSQNVERKLARFLYAGRNAEMRSIVTTKIVDADESRSSILPDVALSRAPSAPTVVPSPPPPSPPPASPAPASEASASKSPASRGRPKAATPRPEPDGDDPPIMRGPPPSPPPMAGGVPPAAFDLDALDAAMDGDDGWSDI